MPKTFGQHPKHEGPSFGGGVKSVLPGFEVFVFDGFVAKQLGDGVAEVCRRLCHGAVHHEAISMDQLHKLIRAHVADHHHLVGFVDLGQGGIDIGGETHRESILAF